MDRNYSVVIPAFNAAETIGEALESILSQSLPPVAVIVVDDGSTDDTASRAAACGARVKVLRQQNQGCGSATTAGIAAVETDLLAFLDSDDVWLPGKAELQIAALDQRQDLAGVFARMQTFKGPLSSPVLGAVADMWGRPTLTMRTAAARAIGPIIDPVGGRGDLVDWISRARDLGCKFEMMPEVLALRRIRPGSLSYGRDPAKDAGYLEVVKRALDRKRAAAGRAPA